MQELASVPIKRLTPNFIQNWHRSLFKKGASDPLYIMDVIKLLKRSFSYCIGLRLLTTSPFNILKPISIFQKIRNRFTTSQMKEVMPACMDVTPEFYYIFVLAYLLGLRLGEYSAIKPCENNYE